jgi:DNA-binding transcriptional MocR family regulator
MANNQNPENMILESASIGRLEREPRFYEKLADKILELISAGTWNPGFRLPPERELPEAFGVSRTVVREAVEALESRGCWSPLQEEVEKLFRSIRKLTADGAGP